jgi:tetratricopeptide (TPR) repeat protein
MDECGQLAFFCYRERLLKKSSGFVWKEPVHECVEFGGNILTSDISIVHKKTHKTENRRNLEIYETWIAKGGEISPRGLYYYARELAEHGRTKDAIDQFDLFLDMGKGWVEDSINACCELANCYTVLNNPNLALLSLYRSFLFDLPCSEACCRIGVIHLNKQEYKNAIFWLNLAIKSPARTGWGFMHPDYSDYVPYMELAVCYDRLGDIEMAESFNSKAGVLKPDAPEFLYNKKYFAAVKNGGSCRAVLTMGENVT